MPHTPVIARASVDAAGRFSRGDLAAFTRLGLDPATDRIRVPAHRRVAWQSDDGDELYSVSPASDGEWLLELFLRQGGRNSRAALSPENLAAFARSPDFAETIKNLAASFAAGSGLDVPLVVLIDPSGDPTFAGGTTQDYRQLAAMEQCRRAAAPMAIWQAFEEQRMTVDPAWIRTVMTDDRFTAIRNLLPPAMEDELVYVAIPLRNDRTVIGVAAGFWPRESPITALQADLWLSLADEMAMSIQLSELLRRAQLNGAEAERIRINDDIHAGLAQSIFALSLEIARVSAGRSAPEAGDLRALQGMADELSADVRGFLSDGRAGNDGTTLAARLRELTDDLRAQTGAVVTTDHQIDWDEYGNDFADYVVRVVAEAFRNIIKHSTATHISFRASVDEDSQHMVIVIADDGHNAQTSTPAFAGAGLGLIRELTAQWKGQVSFTTADRGATLRIQALPEHQSEWAVAQRILQSGTDDD